MKWLKRIAIAILALVVLFVVVGLLLPSRYHVERSVVIAAPPERIHVLVGDLERWPDWEPWLDLDPSIRTTLGETTVGVGASQSWVGNSGNGELTFTSWDPRTGVVYDLAFDQGKIRSVGSISYEPVEGGTKVTWDMSGENGMNPLARYFGLLMDAMVGPPFEMGLEKLKAATETAPVPQPPEVEAEAPAPAES